MVLMQLIFFTSIASAATSRCPEGTFFRRAHFRKAYIRADGTRVQATRVKSGCVEKQAGYDYWVQRLMNGLPPNWSHKQEFAQGWTEEYRIKTLEALDVLPEILFKGVNGIYRLKRSKHGNNPASHGGNMVVLYDSAFDESRNLARIIAHELAH